MLTVDQTVDQPRVPAKKKKYRETDEGYLVTSVPLE